MNKASGLLALIVLAAIIVVSGRAMGKAQAPGPKPISPATASRNAVVVAAGYLKIQHLIEQGTSEEALRLLDSFYLQQLALLQLGYYKGLDKDLVHVDLKQRLIKGLQERWLRSPPEYLPDSMAEYMAAECAKIRNCPRGVVHGQNPIPGAP